MTIPTPTNSPNLVAKNLLAKLMAAEDLVVEHDSKAHTASFNMETRVLTLPVWKDLDADTLDMLIGHEVSHALHTPAGRDPLETACKSIDSKNPSVAKDYLNVVEDARIERMIKDRFPGLRKSFAAGYRELVKRDLFGLKKVDDLKTLPLIDRINLQYKIGWLIDVPFSASELSLAQQVAKTVTWEDVVALSKAIYEFAKQQGKDKDSSNSPDSQENDGSGTPQGGDDGDDGESDRSLPSDKESEKDGYESSRNVPTDGDGDKESDENSEKGNADSDDEGDDADAEGKGSDSNESDSDADDDGDDSDTNNGGGGNRGETDDTGSKDDDAPAPTSITMKNTEDALKSLVDQNAATVYYADLPEIDKGFIVDLKDIQASLRDFYKTNKTAAETVYAAWKAQNAGAVQVLATEFDRRKAADAHKRTLVAETGSIDPNRLHAYRIAEDIFLSNTYVKDGKNHGLVLLLDMSGSMSSIFYDTMVQLVTLAHFCRRVNIPFSFYGYTDRAYDLGKNAKVASFKKNSFNANKINTRLVTLLQDGMKQHDFVETCGLLLLSAYDCGGNLHKNHPVLSALNSVGYRKPYHGLNWMCLDNTPTNAALLGLPTVMEEFKRVKRVQVTNLIVLTDGEASDNLLYGTASSDDYKSKVGIDQYGCRKNAKIVWRDKTKRKNYDAIRPSPSSYQYFLNCVEQSSLLLSIIQDRVGGKTVCIHLCSPRDGKELVRGLHYDNTIKTHAMVVARDAAIDKAVANWKSNRWVAVPTARGFSEYIVIAVETNCEDAPTLDDVDLNSNSAIRDLRKAFTKSMAATKANRPLLTRVADLISK